MYTKDMIDEEWGWPSAVVMSRKIIIACLSSVSHVISVAGEVKEERLGKVGQYLCNICEAGSREMARRKYTLYFYSVVESKGGVFEADPSRSCGRRNETDG